MGALLRARAARQPLSVAHGLRVLAIISVLQLHVTRHLRRLLRTSDLTPLGLEKSRRIFFGMDLFFILSGFLIGAILLGLVE